MTHDDILHQDESIFVEAIFSIGSNFGDRQSNVSNGLAWLSNHLLDFKCSSIYATPDCHGGDYEYLNAVAKGLTSASPQQLENFCKNYESSCGRDEKSRITGIVPIDIDLVVFDSNILRPNDFKREFFKIGYRMI